MNFKVSKLNLKSIDCIRNNKLINNNLRYYYNITDNDISIIEKIHTSEFFQHMKLIQVLSKTKTSIIIKYYNEKYREYLVCKILTNNSYIESVKNIYNYLDKVVKDKSNISICDIFKISNQYILMSKYYEYDLFDFLNSYANVLEKFPNQNKIFKKLIEIVYKIHYYQIIHGDIKVENIFLNYKKKFTCDKFNIVLGDFDGSKCNIKGHSLSSITLENCPYYVKRVSDFDKKDDIFCLGMVFLYILDYNLYSVFVDIHKSQRNKNNISIINMKILTTNLIRGSISIKKKYKKFLIKMLDPFYDTRISSKQLCNKFS